MVDPLLCVNVLYSRMYACISLYVFAGFDDIVRGVQCPN